MKELLACFVAGIPVFLMCVTGGAIVGCAAGLVLHYANRAGFLKAVLALLVIGFVLLLGWAERHPG